jgi:hypothetical protein
MAEQMDETKNAWIITQLANRCSKLAQSSKIPDMETGERIFNRGYRQERLA